MHDAAVLEAIDLYVRFGGVVAVDGLSMSIQDHTLVGLIGPNGAGKTTTIDALTGFVPHRGQIKLAGTDIDDFAAHERAQRGLVRTWQSLELFDDLTVRENCLVAAVPQRLGSLASDLIRPMRPIDGSGVDDALDLLGLGSIANRRCDGLSLGEQKLVAVARALAQRPRVLLLDEPAAGLDSDESLALGTTLRSLLELDLAILLVDHDMGLVLSVCDKIAVLDFGRLIAFGSASEIRSDPRVVEAYLGATP
ncbi:MAG: ATP-binding cassette domain-containing protein [Actinomycetes bacterium]